eukprot:15327076-Alexandrium_andersonii.AAC.1
MDAPSVRACGPRSLSYPPQRSRRARLLNRSRAHVPRGPNTHERRKGLRLDTLRAHWTNAKLT